MVREKRGDLVAVLLRQHRAGDVDEPAARLAPGWRRASSTARCSRLALGKVGGLQPPLGIGPAPPGARARAGRIDEHQVEAGPERRQRRLVARVQHLDVAHAGPLQPLEDRPQLRACRRRRRRSGRCCCMAAANASVLPPAPAHKIEHLLARARRRPAARRSASPRPAPRTSPCRAPVSASTLRLPAGPVGRRQRARRRGE